MKIALDVMGGDFAPQNPMGGVKLALSELPQIDKIYLVGQPEAIDREMRAQGIPMSDRLEIVSAMQIVDMSDSGLDAVRKKKDSSITRAVDLVKEGKADAVVSSAMHPARMPLVRRLIISLTSVLEGNKNCSTDKQFQN